MDGSEAIEDRRRSLARAGAQAWRLELHACALTTSAAQVWLVIPPAADKLGQQAAVRWQLRVLAVRLNCLLPLTSWWRLCRERRLTRLANLRSQAAEAVRKTRLCNNLLAETLQRVRKQDATLRALGRRARLREAVGAWAGATMERASLRRALLRRQRSWLRRWAAAIAFCRALGLPSERALRRRACAAALRALRACARTRMRFVDCCAGLALVRVIKRWRRALCARRRRRAAAAVCERALRTLSALRALRLWRRALLRWTRRRLTSHRDEMLKTLLRAWACGAAGLALSACGLSAAPDRALPGAPWLTRRPDHRPLPLLSVCEWSRAHPCKLPRGRCGRDGSRAVRARWQLARRARRTRRVGRRDVEVQGSAARGAGCFGDGAAKARRRDGARRRALRHAAPAARKCRCACRQVFC